MIKTSCEPLLAVYIKFLILYSAMEYSQVYGVKES